MSTSAFYDLSDFCVAIPHDRFIIMRALERDNFRLQRQVASLTWSGVELASVVRRRLSLLNADAADAHTAADTASNRIILEAHARLPKELTFEFAGRTYQLPLFAYILRHSFWRPRDILFYYSTLLAAAASNRQSPLATSFVRQIVASATRSVVDDEFVGEYSAAFVNLRDVLMAFRRAPQVLSWAEVANRLADVPFEMVAGPRYESIEMKVELLYEIGAIGVVLDPDRAERWGVHPHAFVFNEGALLLARIDREAYCTLRFAMHPVLVEYLYLDTSANQELILAMDWRYINGNDARQQNAGPG